MSNEAIFVIVVLGIAIVLFITEALPVNLTIMLSACILVAVGIVTPAELVSGFASSTIVMIVAMMVVGGALFETGVCDKIARVAAKYAKTERQMIMAIYLITGGISSVMSDTASMCVLIPLIIGMCKRHPEYSASRLIFSSFLGSLAGGRLTLIGDSSVFLKLAEYIESVGGTFGMFEPTKIGVPLFIINAVWLWAWGWKVIPVREIPAAGNRMTGEFNEDTPAWKQVASVVILVLVVIGIIFSPLGLPPYMFAVMGAVAVALLRIFRKGTIYNSMDWSIVIMMGGCVPLASALSSTGAADTLANGIVTIIGGSTNPYLICTVVFLMATVLTQFMSNVVMITLFAPICISLSATIGANPVTMLIVMCMGGLMSFLTPISCGMSNLAYTYGGFKFVDFFKVNISLAILTGIACIVLIPMIWSF